MINSHLLRSCLGGLLPLALLAVACSAATPTPTPTRVDAPPLQPTERRMQDPGGLAVITQWSAQGESIPRVVQASGYRSGMRLIDGVSLVFHAQQQRWVHMLNGETTELLEEAPPGERLRLVQPAVDAPVLLRARFRHLDHGWTLVVIKLQEPPPEIPGVSTEGQHALDLVLVRDSANPENENR